MYMDLYSDYKNIVVLKLDGIFINGEIICWQNHLDASKRGYYQIYDAKTYKDVGLYLCKYLGEK